MTKIYKKVIVDPKTWVDPADILPSARFDTLEESIEYVSEVLGSSASEECPCCGQIVKLYPRKLHDRMAAFLCALVRIWKAEKDNAWIHIRRINTGEKASTDASYLVHWGLVERESGMYRPTKKGVRFAMGKIRVPSHAMVYNRKYCLGFSGTRISIKDALGEKFDLDELLYGKWV